MANDKRRRGGRVTPPKGAQPSASGRSRRSPGDKPLGQVGKRPSNPAMLLLLGVMWIGGGVVAFIDLHASWRLIPSIAFTGVGLLYLRAAGTTFLRQEGRR